MGITPDAIFGLRFLDKPRGKNTAYFFLEADRGTMTVVARRQSSPSFFRKLATYRATYVQKLHTKRFGIKSFRVLTVTSSGERVASLVEATKRLKGLQGLFLFTHQQAIEAGDALGLLWVDGYGKKQRLLT